MLPGYVTDVSSTSLQECIDATRRFNRGDIKEIVGVIGENRRTTIPVWKNGTFSPEILEELGKLNQEQESEFLHKMSVERPTSKVKI
jgi:hypothetical protein